MLDPQHQGGTQETGLTGTCPVPGDRSTSYVARRLHPSCQSHARDAGAIHNWEKLLPAAHPETGLGPVPSASAAGRSLCLIGGIAALQPRTEDLAVLPREAAGSPRAAPLLSLGLGWKHGGETALLTVLGLGWTLL